MLLALNTYANKNWIEFDTQEKNNQTQNNTDLKMSNPQYTLESIKQLNQSTRIENTNNPDADLFNVMKKIYDVTQKIESKIKK